jgi:hypothetical protein
VTGGAHDTLRDELARVLGPRGETDEHLLPWDDVDLLLPVVLRYADAQVAAERERIAALLVDAAFVEAVKDYLRELSDEPWPPYSSEVLAAAALLIGEQP